MKMETITTDGALRITMIQTYQSVFIMGLILSEYIVEHSKQEQAKN